ncbi:MAG: hypothetical protein QM731_17985 [Chitinophagaceae bacterium]
MDPAYYPFLYYAITVLIVEVTVYLLMRAGLPQVYIAVINIHTLLECWFFSWLFHNWGLFNRNRTIFLSIAAGFTVLWVALTIFVNGITHSNFYFRVLYSFALIFFSVSTFNKMVVQERGNIFKNARFWICLGIIIFYTFFTMICVTSISWQHVSKLFRRNLQSINVFSNLFVNILYAIAMLWIPRNKRFTNLLK